MVKENSQKPNQEIGKKSPAKKRQKSVTGAFLDETKIVTRGWLLDRGYNFEYYTNVLHTKKGDYHFCYEFGHLVLEDGKILVVMTDRYIQIKVRAHDGPKE